MDSCDRVAGRPLQTAGPAPSPTRAGETRATRRVALRGAMLLTLVCGLLWGLVVHQQALRTHEATAAELRRLASEARTIAGLLPHGPGFMAPAPPEAAGNAWHGAGYAQADARHLADALARAAPEPGQAIMLLGEDGNIRLRLTARGEATFDGTLAPDHPVRALLRSARNPDGFGPASLAEPGGPLHALHGIPGLPLAVVVSDEARPRTPAPPADAATGLLALATALLWLGFGAGLWRMHRIDRLRAVQRRVIRRARARSHARASFLGSLSHELRTPLTGVLGYASLIERRSAEAPVREMAATVGRCAHHLARLLDEVLDASRADAGALSVELAPAPIREIVAETCALYRPAAEARQLAFECRIDDAVPATVVADPTRLRQALANLVANAVKFTARGSIVVTARVERGGLRVDVTDTGPGIPPDARARLFERFVQADATVRQRHGGTGLGLAIARDLVRRMGGDITLASDEGRGTTASLALPIAPPPAG